jgi:hypothetical protein
MDGACTESEDEPVVHIPQAPFPTQREEQMPFKISAYIGAANSFVAEGETFEPAFATAFTNWINKVPFEPGDAAAVVRLLGDASKIEAVAADIKAKAAQLDQTAPTT